MVEELSAKQSRPKSSTGDFAQLNLLGSSPDFLEALHVIERIASVDATVLIQGETGTGKELAARALHYLSHRRDFPFIPINCGALPDNLLESELFGHARGAFTDAKQANRGLVAQAEGGTLFLDEVEVMTPRAQVVLLRFLQDHKYRPVGGHQLSISNVRTIASSNVDLEDMTRSKEFRRDLLFRLSILTVTMPPLRERGNDIVMLAEHFLRRFALQYGRPPKLLHPDTITWLLEYEWRGNIRELENMMLREFLLNDGEMIKVRERMKDVQFPAPKAEFNVDRSYTLAKAQAIAEFEKTYLGHLLSKTSGNISLAARISGKDRSALNKLVKKHGLRGERHRPIST